MRKFENFSRTLENLEIAAQKENYSLLEETGLIAMFEICFEQSWKVLKEILENEGYRESKTGSPRQILKLAYSAGILNNEEIWLEILNDRNILLHVYDSNKVQSTIVKIKEKYLSAFKSLKKIVKENYIGGNEKVDA